MKFYVICTLYIFVICILAEINQRQMAEIGKVIKDMLRCSKKHSGKKFLKNIVTYNDYLEDVLRNVDEYTNLGLRQYRYLMDHKGPPHVNLEFNRNGVKVLMNITSDQVTEAEQALNRTSKLWDEIQATYDKRTYSYERTAILVDNYTFISD